MPRTNTAKRALRQSIRRKKENAVGREEYRKAVRTFKKLVAGGNKDEAKKFLPTLYKKLDKSSKNSLIKKNKASRMKSRLTKSIK